MKVICIPEPGGPDVLTLIERPALELPHAHIRVAVKYAGVNRADVLQRMGHYPAPPGTVPDVPGLEYAGVVAELGTGATRFRVGDRVYGLTSGGSYATEVVVHEREAVAIPANLDDEKAAAVPEAFLTAYDALLVRGKLKPGENVLISAAGSGVGTAGIQIARALGCLVMGTSRTAAKLERCKPLGMHVGIAVTRSSFADDVRAATRGRGADVVLELVGGAYVQEDMNACALGGRIVLVGLTGGGNTEMDLRMLLTRRLELVGTVLRSRPLEEKIAAAQLLERNINPWLASETIKPVVDRVFPFGNAPAAHAYLTGNESFGKVLLKVE